MRMWIPMHKMPSYLNYKKRKRFAANNFLLKAPKTEKLCQENVMINGLEVGHSSMQGFRVTMEDEHIIEKMTTLSDHSLFAILDGHAGKVAAKYTAKNLLTKLEQSKSWKEYLEVDPSNRSLRTDLIEKALVEAYKAIDDSLRELKHMDGSGCTAVCTVVTPSHIICANVGDSRCVIGSSGCTISMTEDHKPSNPLEQQRINESGGFVLMDRVNGELAMSRALGDFRYKENPDLDDQSYAVICYPDITVHERNATKDEVMVLACDGVWDVLSNEETIYYMTDIVFNSKVAGDNIRTDVDDVEVEEGKEEEEGGEEIYFGADGGVRSKRGAKITKTRKRKRVEVEEGDGVATEVSAMEAAESLVDLAFNEGSTDNISALVVKFEKIIKKNTVA